jgi:hypothetical protein
MDLLRNLQRELRRTADDGLAKIDAVDELFKAEVLYKYVHNCRFYSMHTM